LRAKIGLETRGSASIGQTNSAAPSSVRWMPKVDAMVVHSSPVFVDQASPLAELAREFRFPVGLFPIYAKAGGSFLRAEQF